MLLRRLNPWGAPSPKIIRKVLLPEALPTIIDNVTVLIVNLIGYSAMAGDIGGGGGPYCYPIRIPTFPRRYHAPSPSSFSSLWFKLSK